MTVKPNPSKPEKSTVEGCCEPWVVPLNYSHQNLGAAHSDVLPGDLVFFAQEWLLVLEVLDLKNQQMVKVLDLEDCNGFGQEGRVGWLRREDLHWGLRINPNNCLAL